MSTGKIIFSGSSERPEQLIAEQLVKNLSPETSYADFSQDLVILPGQQAIRAVSAELTNRFSALLPPLFLTAGRFCEMGNEVLTPSRTEQKAVWMDVLESASETGFPHLFPQGLLKTEEVLSWHAGELCKLRRELELSAVCHTFSAASSLLGNEDERWKELAVLEQRFLAGLAGYGFSDPGQRVDPAVLQTECFLSFRRIILAACPDLSPVAKVKWNRISEFFAQKKEEGAKVPEILVLVMAPPEDTALFDEWGCVIPERWQNQALPFGQFPGRIHAVQNPEEMGQLTAKLAVDPATKEFHVETTSVVITDPSFFPEMEKSFSGFRTDHGSLPVYDPNGVSMKQLRIVPCLTALHALFSGETLSSDTVKAILQQEDLLHYFAGKAKMSADHLLKAWDEFALEKLPEEITLQNMPEEKDSVSMRLLRAAFLEMMEVRDFLRTSQNILDAVRKILGRIFCMDALTPKHGISIDDEAKDFRKIAGDFEKSPILSALPAERKLSLMEEALSGISLYPAHAGNAMEITGFLDMPFHPAQRLILCGMNEGLLPESMPPTPFLNDSTRAKLGLPGNASRYARDCFYMKQIFSRIPPQNIHFIACRTDSDGSPLRYSTLFFAGVEELKELLNRAAVLFESSPAGIRKVNAAKELPFHAEIDLKEAFLKNGETVLSVTDFKALLESPLRTFMDRKLNMQPVDYEQMELDAPSIGTMVHGVLQFFDLKPEWTAAYHSGDPARFQAAVTQASGEFQQELFRIVKERVGQKMPLLPLTQTEQFCMRVRKTAEELIRGSHSVLEREWSLGGGEGILFGGARIRGKIDRIEYDTKSKTLFLIDFKTGSEDADPAKSHLASGKFFNLQLPLYKLLLQQDTFFREKHPETSGCFIRCGYFLIKNVQEDIGYHFWEGMEEYDSLAEKTALTVIDMVKQMQQGVLPEDLQKKTKYDNYMELFPGGMAETFSDIHTVPPPDLPEIPKQETKKTKTKKSGRKEMTEHE